MDIPTFNGGWSYTQWEMNDLFKHIVYKNEYSILEFCAGDSSTKLFNHFKKYVEKLHYTIYESNFNYLPKNLSDYEVHFYDENDIESVSMPNNKFDLILIDGGHSYKTVKSDFNFAKKLVTTNGAIFFDDYVNKQGVIKEGYGINKVVHEINRANYSVRISKNRDIFPKSYGLLLTRMVKVQLKDN